MIAAASTRGYVITIGFNNGHMYMIRFYTVTAPFAVQNLRSDSLGQVEWSVILRDDLDHHHWGVLAHSL